MSRKRDGGPDGVLVIDKPSGMTSHDVVDAVRRRFKTRRVGHAGTLDPAATGVLLLGLGRATRFLSYAQSSPKRYRATAVFGATTTTQDASGEVVERRPVDVDAGDVSDALKSLTGDIEQIPPMVSAVKVGGERLYRRALRGEEIERAPRRATVYSLELLSFEDDPPTAELEVLCSAGTYVRTLVHDLGEVLGCGAHLSRLRRTEAGGFNVDEAVDLGDVDESKLLPPAAAVRVLRRIEIDADRARLVANGRRLPLLSGLGEGDEPVALINDGRLVAVYRRKDDELVPDRVMPS